jgi:hypothetical protein
MEATTMSDTSQPIVTPPISPFLLELLECVCEEISTTGQGPVCWCGLLPGGLVPYDFCNPCSHDVCGMAYINVGYANPYTYFPSQTDDISCQRPIAYAMSVGVARCAPTMSDDGDPPSAEEMTEATLGLMQDQWALHRAIRCCRENWKGMDAAIAIADWNPTGVEGGCLGGAWSLVVDPL